MREREQKGEQEGKDTLSCASVSVMSNVPVVAKSHSPPNDTPVDVRSPFRRSTCGGGEGLLHFVAVVVLEDGVALAMSSAFFLEVYVCIDLFEQIGNKRNKWQ